MLYIILNGLFYDSDIEDLKISWYIRTPFIFIQLQQIQDEIIFWVTEI